MTTNKQRKQMKKWREERRNINFFVSKGLYDDFCLLTENMEINSISKLMRIVLYEWCLHKKEEMKHKVYEDILTRLVDTYTSKQKPISERLDTILKLDEELKYWQGIEK